ncbi:methyl-accepting chemotaxis protein [Anaerobacillus sp. CMMVII]|uniref:methyl-accepting chemotaxis protein n=1 Tax=Anaerobacillus sp. CMMVII TaxID=2755588 RepID=UPI0021B7546A|nr:methyl-accepting chemotaxis protein [Anaerobacillus sp. CMMVII]MCT8137042.1 methyl-accepting chemotaxis protein [Anaerobacillus sp. CMMVII]
MFKSSLKAKLTIFFIGTLLLSLTVVSSSLMYRSYHYTNQVMNDRIDENYLVFDTIMKQENLRLSALVETIAVSNFFQESLSGDRVEGIKELIKDQSYQYHLNFATNFKTNIFAIYSPDMSSVFYINNNNRDLSQDPFLQKALETRKRLEQQSVNQHGMELRSVGPIYNANKELVGFVEIAKYFDNAYFDQLVHATGTEVTIFNGTESVVSTIFDLDEDIPNTPESRLIGLELEDKELLEPILMEGDYIVREETLKNGRVIKGGYYPIQLTNGDLAGVLFVGFPIDKFKQQQIEDMVVTSIIFLVLLVLVGTITLIYLHINLNPIKKLSSTVTEFAEYDYRSLIEQKFLKKNNEIGDISRSLSVMRENTKSLIEVIQSSSSKLNNSADEGLSLAESSLCAIEEITVLVDEINKSVELEHINLQESSTALDSVAVAVSGIVNTLSVFAEEIQKVNEQTNSGTQLINSSVEKFDEISKNSAQIKVDVSELVSSLKDISSFVTIIKNLAEQTNLLSLNASIEAARAGANGRGFAVVAQEIRALAAQSAKASEDINTIVAAISESSKRSVDSLNKNECGITEGVNVISKIVSSFETIDYSVKELTGQADILSATSEEISATIEEVYSSVVDIENLSQKNRDAVASIATNLNLQKKSTEELVVSSSGLTRLADSLSEKIDSFKL